MNVVWLISIVISLVVATATDPSAVSVALVSSSQSALNTSTTLLTVYAFWTGYFNVLYQSGFISIVAKCISPLLRFLFGNIDDKAKGLIALNLSSNIVGVSNASTPSAVSAMEILEKDNVRLSRAGATLFVLNAGSLQIFPSTVVGLRESFGSSCATDVVLPTVICTFFTTFLGLLLVRIAYGGNAK